MTRGEACLTQLKELNPTCTVGLETSDDIAYIVQNFTCVVVLDNYDQEYLVKLNHACHKNSIGFILGGNLGLYGYTFVDFGEAHKVFDTTGEECKLIHIAGITKEEQGVVLMHENKRHGLNDGDTILFREVKGMTEINGTQHTITVKTPNSFLIGNTKSFSNY